MDEKVLRKLKEIYSKKNVSILGDSISTLEGFNPEGYNVFYRGQNCKESDVYILGDTWWGEVIESLGACLLENNSWSGSLVSAPISQDNIFPSASSDERTSTLESYDKQCDAIIILIGINDYSSGIMIDGIKRDVERYNYRYFSFAYDKMLCKLKHNYPNAEIMCCTIPISFLKDNSSFIFPLEYNGVHVEDYNNAVRNLSLKHFCKVLDIYSENEKYESMDTVHPTKNGMHQIAEMVLKEIAKNNFII